MGSKTLLTALWLVGTLVAAMVAWQSLSFVSASTEGEVTAPTLSESNDARASITSDGVPSTPTTQPSTSTLSPVETSTSSSSGIPSTSTTADAVPAVAPIEQAFDLVGGRVAISFSPSEVAVVWATPAPGYTVDSHPEDGGVEVEFDNGEHESKIEAWWADGPRFETREDDD
jgi:hypothetical protein